MCKDQIHVMIIFMNILWEKKRYIQYPTLLTRLYNQDMCPPCSYIPRENIGEIMNSIATIIACPHTHVSTPNNIGHCVTKINYNSLYIDLDQLSLDVHECSILRFEKRRSTTLLLNSYVGRHYLSNTSPFPLLNCFFSNGHQLLVGSGIDYQNHIGFKLIIHQQLYSLIFNYSY